MNSLSNSNFSTDFNPENTKDSNQETLFCQHLLVCSLQEIGSLVLRLGTTAQDLITDQSQSITTITYHFSRLNLFCIFRSN